MKSRDGKSQRREEKKKRDQKRESFRRKQIQVREKVGKSRHTVFFQWFVAPEARRVGSLKRRVRSHVARWLMNNCTPLWCEAHLQVKKLKIPHLRSTFESWDVEKVHAVLARSTCRSQNAQNTPGPEHFWKLRCRKKIARLCGAKHISKSKYTKHLSIGPLLEVEMSKVHALVARSTFRSQTCKPLTASDHFWNCDVEKVHAVVARSTFRSQNVKNTTCSRYFWSVVSRGKHKGLRTVLKASKTWGFCEFCGMSKNDGRRGTFEEDLQRCIFRGRRSTRDMFIRAARRSRRWFSWDRLRFGASDLQVCWDDFA